MITLITKEEVQIPLDRVVITGKVRMRIDSLMFTKDYVHIKGEYNYLDEEGVEKFLSKIDLYKSKVDIVGAEAVLNSNLSGLNIFDLIDQRAEEMSYMQIQLEDGQNYGTSKDDWELLV